MINLTTAADIVRGARPVQTRKWIETILFENGYSPERYNVFNEHLEYDQIESGSDGAKPVLIQRITFMSDGDVAVQDVTKETLDRWAEHVADDMIFDDEAGLYVPETLDWVPEWLLEMARDQLDPY